MENVLSFIISAQFECQNQLSDVLDLTGASLLLYANMLKEML
jgi:hypothetical protein